ncbi:MAG: D-alanyl-D-alanine dipeptidase [Candidatus Riflebacteria bacterium]|nr:D-alanyl-D-alanine dipeptidase [Candidatus Riflebacteria bacterium]
MKRIFSIISIVFFTLFLFEPTFAQVATQSDLVELTKLDPSIVLDVKYATTNNFTGKILYPSGKVMLREPAARALVKANLELKSERGLKIKVFDGYRPLSVQKKMWEIIHDPKFVADPAVGSNHNRGIAVDVTLVDNSNQELDMGTPFDDFTEKAAVDYKQLTEEQKKNRSILQEEMKKQGFMVLPSEWWHFELKDKAKYPLLDVELR